MTTYESYLLSRLTGHPEDICREHVRRGRRTEVAAQIRAVREARERRRAARRTAQPTVREWLRGLRKPAIRAALIRAVQSVGASPSGAGQCYYGVQYGDLGASHDSETRWPDAGEVARSYKWQIRDHAYYASLPYSYELREVQGVWTVLPRYGARRPVGWIERHGSCGIRLVRGWLVAGVHVPATRRVDSWAAAAEHIRQRRISAVRGRIQARAAAEAAALAAKEQAAARAAREAALTAALPHLWIDADAARAAGNCDPGIAAFRERYERRIGASGEVALVRADALVEAAQQESADVLARVRRTVELAFGRTATA